MKRALQLAGLPVRLVISIPMFFLLGIVGIIADPDAITEAFPEVWDWVVNQ